MSDTKTDDMSTVLARGTCACRNSGSGIDGVVRQASGKTTGGRRQAVFQSDNASTCIFYNISYSVATKTVGNLSMMDGEVWF